MTAKRIALRRDDVCSVCRRKLVAGTKAWWDGEERVVTCEPCRAASISATEAAGSISSSEKDFMSVDAAPDSPAPHIESGVAGRSALREYERRHNARQARLEAKFGRMAGVVKFLTDDPQSTLAWKKGSIGEAKLAASLEQSLGDRAIVLSDRRVPKTRGNIDHVVVATSGVWVVDAKNYTGLVRQRDVGGLFRVDNRLYVGRRDCTKLVNGLRWQVDAVRKALGGRDTPVSSALCFTDAEWGLFAKPFTLKDVYISGPNALARRISEASLLTKEQILDCSLQLSTNLPAKE